jgi:hypothetical protein
MNSVACGSDFHFLIKRRRGLPGVLILFLFIHL